MPTKEPKVKCFRLKTGVKVCQSSKGATKNFDSSKIKRGPSAGGTRKVGSTKEVAVRKIQRKTREKQKAKKTKAKAKKTKAKRRPLPPTPAEKPKSTKKKPTDMTPKELTAFIRTSAEPRAGAKEKIQASVERPTAKGKLFSGTSKGEYDRAVRVLREAYLDGDVSEVSQFTLAALLRRNGYAHPKRIVINDSRGLVFITFGESGSGQGGGGGGPVIMLKRDYTRFFKNMRKLGVPQSTLNKVPLPSFQVRGAKRGGK